MNTLKVVFFTFLVCVIKVVLSIPPHYPQEKVDKEYAKLKDEMKDTPEEKRDERLQEKVVLSRLEKEEELTANDRELGKVLLEKNWLSGPALSIKLRSTIESTMSDLYPGGRPNMGYIKALREMLTSTAMRFMNKRALMVFSQMIEDSSIGTERFIEVVELLYQKLSKFDAHETEGAGVVELPYYKDVEKISAILKRAMAAVHKDFIVTVQLALEPRPETTKIPSPPMEELCCICKNRICIIARGEITPQNLDRNH